MAFSREVSNIKYVDELYEFVKRLFKVQNRLEFQTKLSLIEEGEKRYRNKIPPGYEDNSKIGLAKYNDFFIWQEILNLARKEKKSVIIVTDDLKEDWWTLTRDKKIIEPRQELIEEFEAKIRKKFSMYTTKEFIEKTRSILDISLSAATSKEIGR